MSTSPVATLTKTTRRATYRWEFFINTDGSPSYRAKGPGKKNFIFRSLNDLRDYYRQMIEWGFTPLIPEDENVSAPAP